MLRKFTVKNFKNFDQPFVMDLTKVREYEFKNELLKNGLINKALIWGYNNCGKSNLGAAIMDITRHLTDNVKDNPLYLYYLSGNATDNYVEFNYEFLFDNLIVEYNYRKDEHTNLLYEELLCDQKLLFSYNYETNKYKNNIKEAKTLDLSRKNTNMSLLKYIYNNTLYWDKSSPVKLLMDFVGGMLWFRSLRDNEYIGIMSGSENLNDFIINNHLLKEFENFLQKCGQNYHLSVVEEAGKNKIGVVYDQYTAKFEVVASTGTKSLWLFFYWMHQVDKISFVFLDEFDAFYHYDLAKNILNYVNSKKEFQSILTTHNLFLVNNELMRPDCYLNLDHGKLISFADSTNKVIRQSHNLANMVLGGEFEE